MKTRASCLAVVFAGMAAVATLQADWVGVAATATIDEGDLNKVVLNSDGSAGIRPTISSTSAKLRLQVPETPSLLYPDPRPGDETRPFRFTMRVRDNGPGARVIATLKRVTLGWFGGPHRSDVAATIDSDLYSDDPATGDGWVVVHANYYSSCCWIREPGQPSPRGMDFFDAGWFVEVQLIKNSAEGNPGVMTVGIIRDQP